MKYTGRILITTPLIIIGIFWFIVTNRVDAHSIKPIYYLFFSLIATPLFWYIGKRYDKSIYLTEKFRKNSIELGMSKQAIQEIFDNVDAMLWVDDFMTGEQFVSKGFANIFGFNQNDTLHGLPIWIERIHPEDQYQMAIFYENLAAGKRQNGEIRILSANNEEKWVEVRGTPILDQHGTVVKQAGVITDITERKEMESQLIESEKQFRLLTEYSPLGVLVLQEGTIIYINPAAINIFGAKDKNELTGQNIFQFVQTNYKNEVEMRIQNLINGVEREYLDLKVMGLDGIMKDVEMVSSFIHFNGEPAIMTVAKDITEQKKAQKLMYEIAYHDALTGLPNRKLFEEKMNEALKRAKVDQIELAIMFLDLDGFKAVNDTFGHDSGDLLLQKIAKRLKSCVRADDILSRFAGDEFTILLSEVTRKEAISVAERIIEVIKIPIEINEINVQVTTSIGIAFYPDIGNKVKLIKCADKAMYMAKHSGKNSFQIYQEE